MHCEKQIQIPFDWLAVHIKAARTYTELPEADFITTPDQRCFNSRELDNCSSSFWARVDLESHQPRYFQRHFTRQI